MNLKQKTYALIRDDGYRSLANRIISNTIMGVIFINVAMVIFDFVADVPAHLHNLFFTVEAVSVAVFTVEYILRLWTADLMYPKVGVAKARFTYIRSPMAIVDFLAVLPFYLPFVFPINMVILRLLRLLRLLRILKMSRYAETKTANQILSSIKESVILIDADLNYIKSNDSAKMLFPSIKDIKKFSPVNQIEGFPKELMQINEEMSKELIQFKMDERFFNTTISPVTSGEEILRYVILIMDITEIVNLRRETEEQHKTILGSINYASKIQKNLLPYTSIFDTAFSDYSIIWKPRDIVGGDIYWARNFDEGTMLCIADCTGHGTPGALLTMLVVSILDTLADEKSSQDTARILFNLDQRLSKVLHVDGDIERKIMDIDDGCDIAILFVKNDGSVIFSSGNTNVFVCDGNEVKRHKGQKVFIGEGRISSRDEVKTYCIPANPDNKFYIASDGLFDQTNKDENSFGTRLFSKLILENHHEKQNIISEKIWSAFEIHQGGQPRLDDFMLITFKL